MVRLTSSSPFLHPLSMNQHVTQHPLETSQRPSAAADSHDIDRSTRSCDYDDEESTVLAGNTSKNKTNVNGGDEEHGDSMPPRPSQQLQQHHEGGETIHRPSSSLVEKHRQWSPLPRSVRWRLSLGLLTDPWEEEDRPSIDTSTAHSHNTTTNNTNNNIKIHHNIHRAPPKCTQQILQQQTPSPGGGGGDDDVVQQLQSIEEVNALKVRFQRSRYEELEKKHYWAYTPVGIAGHSINGSGVGSGGGGASSTTGLNAASSSSLHHVARGDDPLSALLEQEEKGLLFGFGGKRRIKRGGGNGRQGVKMLVEGVGGNGGGDVPSNGQVSSMNSGQFEEEEGKGPSSLSSEMLDVIEKDLNRLPSDHYTVYHSWRKRCKGWEDERRAEEEDKKKKEKEDEEGKKGVGNSLADFVVAEEDGGNALVDEAFLRLHGMQAQHHHHYQQQQQQQQQQLQQQKMPFGRRKRFTHTGLAQSFQIGRDRTNFPKLSTTNEEEEDEIDHTKKAEAAEKLEIETSTKERAEKLSQILFVYAQEHKEIGYRQGMHEILSYILLVLEMDLMEHAVALERKRWRTDVLSSLGMSPKLEDGSSRKEGGVAGVDSSGNIVVVHLLDSEYILHDAFTLFECVMEALASAYDSAPTGEEETSAGCLEAMTSSIVSKIRYVARDEALFSHVLYMPVPPQLYFAKWVRLMFGREVAGGMKDVMRLWDAFFELASATASIEDDLSISNALMNVLKTAAASMILLIRHLLLAPTVAWDGSLTGDPDPNEGIAFLMNYPPIEDIGVLVKTITTLLAKEKVLAAQSRQHQESHHVVPTGRRHPLASSAPIVTLDDDPVEADQGNVSRASSSGDFMGWPSSEPDLRKDISPSDDENDHSDGVDLHQNKFDVSETLGNFANGLFGLRTRTVDAAMSTIQKQPQAPPPYDIDNPLFAGITGFMDNDDADYSTENGPEEEPPQDENFSPSIMPESSEDEEDTSLIAITTAALNVGNKKASIADSNVDDNASVTSSSYSKMSVSRSLAETIRKDPKELATKLEKSVSTLMKHFHDQMRARADTSPTSNGVPDHTTMIPEAIWDAMADIDQVRKDLLSQSATEQLDKSPSYMSLMGLEKKVDDIRQSSAAKETEKKAPQKITRRNSLFW
ncbi:hypothetical protein HJC23_007438 [Cyclotella cryptica]|uniref:Rab-GAP TBC domain-containing protein n=1 Tax=Cyclotella cryptica TaxID=29204 RepID=A0ABD3QQ98_9STRA